MVKCYAKTSDLYTSLCNKSNMMFNMENNVLNKNI